MQQPRLSNRLTGAVKFAVLAAVVVACWLVGTATAQTGGITRPYVADRVMVNVLRGDYNRAAARRCRDETSHYRWPDFRRIPRARVGAVLATWEARIRRVRSSGPPRPQCWRSHVWAEGWKGRCVSSKEGSLRSVSRPSGTYHGKWQMNSGFELAYGPGFVRRWGRASGWPEYAQDLAAWRGYRARGWSPWPNTARACGLL